MPMDETLRVGRSRFRWPERARVMDTKVRTRLVGDLQSELVADFFRWLRSRGQKPMCT